MLPIATTVFDGELDILPSQCRHIEHTRGSICNENTFITPPTKGLEIYAICQAKDQSLTVSMVYETLFYLFRVYEVLPLQ